jgi:hypothetical protein
MTKSEENYFIFNTIIKSLPRKSRMEGGRICTIFRDRYSAKKTSVKVVFFDRADPAIAVLAKVCDDYNEFSGRFGFFNLPPGRASYKTSDLTSEGLKRLNDNLVEAKVLSVEYKLDGSSK